MFVTFSHVYKMVTPSHVYMIVTSSSSQVYKIVTFSLGQNKVYPVTSIEHKTDCWKDHEGPLVHLGHDLLQLLPLGVHGLVSQGY